MRLSGAGRAALLVLLAAHFQASLALEEKKGKDARAAVLPVPGGRAFRRAAEECASRFRAAGQPRARGAAGRGARSAAFLSALLPSAGWTPRRARPSTCAHSLPGGRGGTRCPPRSLGPPGPERPSAPGPAPAPSLGSGSRPREPSSQSRLDLEARKLVPGTGHLCCGSGRAEVHIGTRGRVARRLHARVRPELPPPSAPLGRWTLLSGGFPGLPRLAPTCSPWALPASRWMGRSGGTGRGQTAGAWCERPRGGTHPGWLPTVSKQGSQQAFLLKI